MKWEKNNWPRITPDNIVTIRLSRLPACLSKYTYATRLSDEKNVWHWLQHLGIVIITPINIINAMIIFNIVRRHDRSVWQFFTWLKLIISYYHTYTFYRMRCVTFCFESDVDALKWMTRDTAASYRSVRAQFVSTFGAFLGCASFCENSNYACICTVTQNTQKTECFCRVTKCWCALSQKKKKK